MLITCFLSVSSVAGEDNGMTNLESKLKELEDMWAGGKTSEYCGDAKLVVKELVSQKADNGTIRAF